MIEWLCLLLQDTSSSYRVAQKDFPANVFEYLEQVPKDRKSL